MNNNIHYLTLIGVLLNGLVVLYTSSIEKYQELTPISIGCLVLCIIGLLLVSAKKTKIGLIIFIIGSMPFIPISIVGIIGIRKTTNKLNEEKFLKENYGKTN